MLTIRIGKAQPLHQQPPRLSRFLALSAHHYALSQTHESGRSRRAIRWCAQCHWWCPEVCIPHTTTLQALPVLTFSRSFSTRNLTRPSIFPTSALDQPCLKLAISSATSFVSATPILDLMPKISAHPALASMQIRCGPRDTYDPSHRIRKRRSGFLARKGSRTGRMILNRRRQKRRSTLSH